MPYAVSDIITSVNNLIDDSINPAVIVSWINDCLAEMGSAINVIFPEADVTQTTNSLVIPTIWQRRLIIPYVSAKAKQQDSSQFEYSDLYNDFYGKLQDFVARYVPPVQYKMLEPDQTITVNSASYTPVYGDTLQSVADANGTTYQDIINANMTIVDNFGSFSYNDLFSTSNSTETCTIQYISNTYEADYLSNPPYLYGGW